MIAQRIEYGKFVIEVVPIEKLDLLEKNARFMRAETFRRLVENVKADGQVSQLPFCVQRPNGRFLVLSGNHRVKAAKSAELTEIPIIYPTEALTHAQELAIQLSHNAIAGEDDPVILKELWESIGSVDLKQYSGLDDKTLNTLLKAPMPALSDVRLDFRTLTLLFLPDEITKVKDAFNAAKEMVKGDATLLARFGEYTRLLDTLADANASYGIGNSATSLLVLLELIDRHKTDLSEGWYDPELAQAKHKGWVPLSTIFGTEKIPADAAVIVKQAVDKMLAAEELEPGSRWQLLERLSADYLAGPDVAVDYES